MGIVEVTVLSWRARGVLGWVCVFTVFLGFHGTTEWLYGLVVIFPSLAEVLCLAGGFTRTSEQLCVVTQWRIVDRFQDA